MQCATTRIHYRIRNHIFRQRNRDHRATARQVSTSFVTEISGGENRALKVGAPNDMVINGGQVVLKPMVWCKGMADKY